MQKIMELPQVQVHVEDNEMVMWRYRKLQSPLWEREKEKI
jgi:hypothetical protein